MWRCLLQTMSSFGSHTARFARRNHEDKRIASLVAKQMVKVIPQIVSELNENASKSSEESRTDSPKTTFSFKQFKACRPKEFTGEDGPTAMFQWFDSIEVTLRQIDCPENLRTVNATGVFQSRALDWWTAERNKRGNDAAYGLTWDELKDIMMKDFCPPHELQNLEDEFWHIKQEGGDNAGLTARFKQLSIIYLGQVTTPEITIKKYIRALPDRVADFVQAAKTTTIEETFLLAAEINHKPVRAGYFDKASKNLHQVTVALTAPQASKSSCRKRKNNNNSSKNCAVTAAAPLQAVPAQPQPQHRQVATPVTNAPLAKRAYTGPHPTCPTCTYHHPVGIACRYCVHCNMYDHFTANCRTGPRQASSPAQVQAPAQQALLPAPQGQQLLHPRSTLELALLVVIPTTS
ncbi:putative transcription factor interactor and regulator CCHC(Zn) family [Helianthus annuus]|uniref:Transcription factor interactor and regulator CCHC(Zn) family n=1 Tax=Helianthus annuus TaxID=4232 RepID=A0A9K3HWP3_HELAN|nr:putative transcription factor interactor and regulator CCHC(Zn) family [Helianthus annuus]